MASPKASSGRSAAVAAGSASTVAASFVASRLGGAARSRTGLASMWRIVRSAMLRVCWGSTPAPRTRPGLSVSRQAEGAPGAFFTPGPQLVAGIETPPGTAAHEQRNDAAERPAPKRRSFRSALCAARCGGGGGETEHATMIGPGKTRVKRGAKFFPTSAPARARPPRRRPKRPRGRRRAGSQPAPSCARRMPRRLIGIRVVAVPPARPVRPAHGQARRRRARRPANCGNRARPGRSANRRPPQAPREAVRRCRVCEEIGRLSQITAGPPKIRRRERQ